ncbi:zinc ribbon domain-containing protein [soil metagenome]
MPIYAYRCEACGFAKDVLQKVSDPQLTECPTCGKSSFKKQVTAAGFQLKGSGWYVTDFRGGNSGKPAPSTTGDGEAKTPATPAAGGDAASTTSAPASTPSSTADSSSSTPAKSGAPGGKTPSST